MNCKEGDLAIIVGYHVRHDFLGKVVRCIKLDFHKRLQVHFWHVDVEFPEGFFGVADMHLRPIRDNDGKDETLQWAPVPSRELVSSK